MPKREVAKPLSVVYAQTKDTLRYLDYVSGGSTTGFYEVRGDLWQHGAQEGLVRPGWQAHRGPAD